MKKGNNDYLKPVVSNVDSDMSRETLMSYMYDYPDFMETPFKCKESFRVIPYRVVVGPLERKITLRNNLTLSHARTLHCSRQKK